MPCLKDPLNTQVGSGCSVLRFLVVSDRRMSEYDYDFFVIGGGSGGLAASKAASELGAKTAVCDFVKASPQGTSWDLGGTCVNVGCIPKKLMHLSSLYRDQQGDLHGLGWESKSSHSWEEMVTKVNQYIKSINWGSKAELRTAKVKYYKKFATFVDPHTVQLEDAKGQVEKVTAKYFLIACGGRPDLGDYPGAKECCISSDDIFWMKKSPEKTLVVGASYIALECAGFLAGFGYDTTVMVRSILLRGFDQQIAEKIGDYMKQHHVKFVEKTTPSRFEKTESGQVRVYVGDEVFGVYDTVLLAIGRTGCAGWLNLEAAGVEYDKRKGCIVSMVCLGRWAICLQHGFEGNPNVMRIMYGSSLVHKRCRLNLRVSLAEFISLN